MLGCGLLDSPPASPPGPLHGLCPPPRTRSGPFAAAAERPGGPAIELDGGTCFFFIALLAYLSVVYLFTISLFPGQGHAIVSCVFVE